MEIVEVRIVAPSAQTAKKVAEVIGSRFKGSKVDLPKYTDFGDFRCYVTFGLTEEDLQEPGDMKVSIDPMTSRKGSS